MPPVPTAKARPRRTRSAWGLALACSGAVLLLGSGGGSAEATSRILGPLLHWLLPHADPALRTELHLALRKLAHLAEYAALALLARRALAHWPGAAGARLAAGALAWVATVAALDEWRQSFLPERTGALRDVGIDLAGGALALALAFAYTRGMATRRGPRHAP
jgi:VanZ family protein